ncbi:TIGR01777 family oxidoreductase [Amphritea sp. HPY]|uniref:TIGR01777 family oxidoreductase n=1 Tax=Amphritea sp. HPY TaxID=3421652 RepID=UPI003D7E23FD
MKILLTGATGFIGKHLVPRLMEYTHEPVLLVRSADKARRLFGDQVRVVTDLEQLDNHEQINGIINLAGEGIVDQRWSEQRKQVLLDSRLDTTRQLIQFIKRLEHKPEVLISGSAVGYYGSQEGDQVLAEDSVVVDGYPHQLCQQWEQLAEEAQAFGLRVCIVRTGIVLGHGGALAKMLPAFRLGLGGRIDGGQQWMSWIHVEDEVEVICMMLTHTLFTGAYNLTAPEAVTNAEFSRELASVLHRPAWFTVPGFVLDLMLGEGSELLLKGQRVYPEKLMQAGYKFAFPDLRTALNQVLLS